MLVDVANWGDRNVMMKGRGKILKYKELKTEIQRMWNGRTKVTPVTITVSESFGKYLSSVPGKYIKQSYWALHTYCRKWLSKGSGETAVQAV